MSSNDTAMTRFLFAILKQKNLKDIDWNKVAHDPILAQEITNGHAARMRYSRFRSAMLGLEPQRRNRKSDKNKVTKPKREQKTKRGNDREPNIKGEDDYPADNESVKPDPEALNAARVKQEAASAALHGGSPSQHHRYETKFIPTAEGSGLASQQQSQHRHALHHRLLTPSSDSDLLHPQTQLVTAAASPESLLSVASGFDLASAATASCGPDQPVVPWQVAPDYSSNFDAAFYPPSSCEQQQRNDEMMIPTPHTPVKHESWESHFPPV